LQGYLLHLMICKILEFSDHAINQMFKRDISVEDVRQVIEMGEAIAEYPNDRPFPSFLMLGRVNLRYLHVVVARDERFDKCIVITAYEPAANIWEEDFKTKKKKL
jgi:hypothetical protein